MPINIILCAMNSGDHLELCDLNLYDDRQFFKAVTTGHILVVGRKTWEVLPDKVKNSHNRIFMVLSRKDNSLANFWTMYNSNPTQTVFIAGGGEIYDLFMNDQRVDNIFLTLVSGHKTNHPLCTYTSHVPGQFALVYMSKKYDFTSKISYRILKYKNVHACSDELLYMNLCKQTLSEGSSRTDRTGTGTRSIFGVQLVFDISNNVPVYTTKKVAWRSALKEMLWFLRGETDSNTLVGQGVNIWKGNTSREFLDKRDLYEYKEGLVGPLYGWQMRAFGAKYNHKHPKATMARGGFDQLAYVENLLKTDPTSRRIVMSYWDPREFQNTVLNPCHYTVQFYVRNENILDCHFVMRSNDLFLGNPFNIFGYSVLTYILAKRHGFTPGKLVYTCGDAHIYNNHIDQMNLQLSRDPRPLPVLVVSDDIISKGWDDIDASDFDLVGYFPHSQIKGEMAI